MRRHLPYLVALMLGAFVALLAACGDGGSKAGISADEASDLKSQIEDVSQRVDDARCQPLTAQLGQVDKRVDGLPSSVDAQLRQRLRDGAEKLRQVARDECDENRQAKETETTTETTPTPEPTATQPAPTTPKPPSTGTTPTPTTPSPPPAPEPSPPPDPGGGTSPGIEE